MKIIQMGPVPPEWGGRDVGGIATHLSGLALTLSDKGHEVDVLTTSSLDKKVNGNVNVVGMNSKVKLITFFILNIKSTFQLIMSKSKKEIFTEYYFEYIKSRYSPDDIIIHCHSLHNYFCDKLIREGFRVVYTDHGFWQSEHINEAAINYRVDRSLNVISVSNYAKSRLEKIIRTKDSEDKIVTIHNPIECVTEPREENILRRGVFFNGYSESVKRKGLDILIKSLAELGYRDEVTVVCDEDGQHYLDKQTLDLGFKVNSFGKQKYKVIEKLYRESSLMVLPSRSESFGLVYIEALMCGVPVVGYAPVIEEFNLLFNMEVGVPFNPETEDYVALSRKIDYAINKEWDMDEIRVRIKNKFSWLSSIGAYESIYNVF